MFIPFRILLHGGAWPVSPCVSFSRVPEGDTVRRDLEVQFADKSAVWRKVELKLPKGKEGAVTVTDTKVSGKKLTVSVSVDSRLLGGKGSKYLPLVLQNQSGDQRVFFSMYGYVY